MKKVLFLGVLLALLTACGSDDDDPVPALSVSTGEVTLEAGDVETTIDVKANSTWNVSSAATDWCTVSPASGTNDGQFTIKVTANPDMQDRSTTVTVKSPTLEKVITVKQDPASLESLLEGKWILKDQTGPEPAFDVMIGITLELNADKSAVAVIDRNVTPELHIGTLEGIWSISGQTLTLSSTIMDIPTNITFEIGQVSADTFQSSMKISIPGLLPADGLPVIINREK